MRLSWRGPKEDAPSWRAHGVACRSASCGWLARPATAATSTSLVVVLASPPSVRGGDHGGGHGGRCRYGGCRPSPPAPPSRASRPSQAEHWPAAPLHRGMHSESAPPTVDLAALAACRGRVDSIRVEGATRHLGHASDRLAASYREIRGDVFMGRTGRPGRGQGLAWPAWPACPSTRHCAPRDRGHCGEPGRVLLC